MNMNMKKVFFGSLIVIVSAAWYFSDTLMLSMNKENFSFKTHGAVPFAYASTENKNCQLEYQTLLNDAKENFSACSVNPQEQTTVNITEKPRKKNNMVLVFDSSGSMATKVGGVSKIDQAKSAAKTFLQNVDGKDLNVSIIAYGHKGSNNIRDKATSCSGVDEIYYMGPVNAKIAQGKLDVLNATGWTPISDALKKAESILGKYSGDQNINSILLLSDGEETCGGNPIETAKRLKESGLKVHVNVIGFDVAGNEEKQLQEIANAGGGDYFSAKKQDDLSRAFQKHADFLAKFDNTIAMAHRTLEDITTIGDTFFTCLMNLEKEKANIILNMYAQKKVRLECQNFSEREYQKRYDMIYTQIKTPFDQAMQQVQKNEVLQ